MQKSVRSGAPNRTQSNSITAGVTVVNNVEVLPAIVLPERSAAGDTRRQSECTEPNRVGSVVYSAHFHSRGAPHLPPIAYPSYFQ